jgi:hypothetical protein
LFGELEKESTRKTKRGLKQGLELPYRKHSNFTSSDEAVYHSDTELGGILFRVRLS